MTLNIQTHNLVPKHFKLSDSEKYKLFEKYKVNAKEFPKILKDDPAIVNLKVNIGDVIKIERESKIAGIAYYYRVVVEG